MPVYDKNFRLRKDWIGIIKINLTEKILTRNSNDNVQIALECNFLPINNHIYPNTTIDFGNLWQVSKEYGVWFFILGLGGLINQDEFFCADSPSRDYIAFEHWNKRGKKPITNINWEYIIQIIKDHE